jgi:hypothetical protein
MTEEQAAKFAEDWVKAWNDHELDRILDHYDDSVIFHSPFVVQLAGEPDGRLVGRPRLRVYFAQALERYPDLKFTLIKSLAGVASLTLYYRSVKGLFAAEVMALNDQGKVTRVDAHYAR